MTLPELGGTVISDRAAGAGRTGSRPLHVEGAAPSMLRLRLNKRMTILGRAERRDGGVMELMARDRWTSGRLDRGGHGNCHVSRAPAPGKVAVDRKDGKRTGRGGKCCKTNREQAG